MTVPPNTPPFSFSDKSTIGAAGPGTASDGRMAVVLRESGDNSAAEKISSSIPTIMATSLGSVVEALAKHEMGALSDDPAHQEAAAELLVGIDITQMPTADAMLLAEGLRHSRACGAVFLMTEAQFSLFDRALFHFVLG